MFPPDLRGGFELHSAEEVQKESHLLEELEKLSVSREKRHASRAFTPLLDIPVDGYDSEAGLLGSTTSSSSSSSSRPVLPNWLLSRADANTNLDPHPALRTDIGTIRSVHFDEVSLHSASDSDRGRSASRNGVTAKGRKERSGERSKDAVFTLQSAARRTRPPLSQVFGPSPGERVGSGQVNGHQTSSENGLSSSEHEQEYELKTVSISKTKQSLGK